MTDPGTGQIPAISRRVIAYIVDAVIGAVISLVLYGILFGVAFSAGSSDPSALLGVLLVGMPLVGLVVLGWFIVYTLMQAGAGSIGMRMQKLRLVDAENGGPIGFWRALLRNIVFGLAGSIVVGYFSPLFDGSGRFQGWHDKAGRAVMQDARGQDKAPAVTPHAAPAAASHAASPSAAPLPASAPPLPTAMPGFASLGHAPAETNAMPPVPPVPPVPPMPPLPSALEDAPASVGAPAATNHPAPVDDEDDFAEQTVITPPIRRDLPDDPLISFVPGITQDPIQRPAPVAETSAPAAEPQAPAPEAQASAVELQASVTEQEASAPEATISPAVARRLASDAPAEPVTTLHVDDDDDLESTRISVPGHRLVFTWDDGQRATVSARSVFGRNPEEGGGAVNVAVRDETRSLSKTHFEAGSDARGGWVMDRQSTNGTTLVRGGERIACPPGQRVPVQLGDVLEIGDRIVTIGGYA